MQLNELHAGFNGSSSNSFGLNKVVSIDLLDMYFTTLSLAVWFMDDGTLKGSGYLIATCPIGRSRKVKRLFNVLSKYIK